MRTLGALPNFTYIGMRRAVMAARKNWCGNVAAWSVRREAHKGGTAQHSPAQHSPAKHPIMISLEDASGKLASTWPWVALAFDGLRQAQFDWLPIKSGLILAGLWPVPSAKCLDNPNIHRDPEFTQMCNEIVSKNEAIKNSSLLPMYHKWALLDLLLFLPFLLVVLVGQGRRRVAMAAALHFACNLLHGAVYHHALRTLSSSKIVSFDAAERFHASLYAALLIMGALLQAAVALPGLDVMRTRAQAQAVVDEVVRPRLEAQELRTLELDEVVGEALRLANERIERLEREVMLRNRREALRDELALQQQQQQPQEYNLRARRTLKA